MPCRDDRDDPGYAAQANKELEKRLDRITQFLCYMCGTAAANEQKMPKPIQAWWEEHFSRDTDRVLREMKQALWKSPIAGKKSRIKTLVASFIQKAEKVHPVSDFHKAWFLKLAEQAYEEEKEKIESVEQKEKLKKAALAKLSDKEKEALGL